MITADELSFEVIRLAYWGTELTFKLLGHRRYVKDLVKAAACFVVTLSFIRATSLGE